MTTFWLSDAVVIPIPFETTIDNYCFFACNLTSSTLDVIEYAKYIQDERVRKSQFSQINDLLKSVFSQLESLTD